MQHYFHCRKFVIMVFASLTCLFISGCTSFHVNNIPERIAFSGRNITQSSMEELRSGYLEHYRLVEKELRQLEKFYNDSEDRPQWIKEKIAGHRKYLSDMEAYPFLCPDHQKTVVTETKEKTCIRCNGSGKRFFMQCKQCSGKGKITYKLTKNQKCSLCKQYYRGSISGRTLNENN